MKKDTIAAISTGMTNSGIGIVRISGSGALDTADRVYRGKSKLSGEPSHTIHNGHIQDVEEAADEVLVMVMRAPRILTCDSSGEIRCPQQVSVGRGRW